MSQYIKVIDLTLAFSLHIIVLSKVFKDKYLRTLTFRVHSFRCIDINVFEEIDSVFVQYHLALTAEHSHMSSSGFVHRVQIYLKLNRYLKTKIKIIVSATRALITTVWCQTRLSGYSSTYRLCSCLSWLVSDFRRYQRTRHSDLESGQSQLLWAFQQSSVGEPREVAIGIRTVKQGTHPQCLIPLCRWDISRLPWYLLWWPPNTWSDPIQARSINLKKKNQKKNIKNPSLFLKDLIFFE